MKITYFFSFPIALLFFLKCFTFTCVYGREMGTEKDLQENEDKNIGIILVTGWSYGVYDVSCVLL